MLILGDMVTFAIFFATYAYYRAEDVETYLAAQRELAQGYGVVNTVLLLTSSWFVVRAVRATQAGEGRSVPGLFVAASVCGLAFLGVKVVEYAEKVAKGITLTTSDFFMFYYVLTGLHLVHVVLGLAVLAFLWNRTRSGEVRSQLELVEGGACFWHMVDAIWIVLFPLLYLMK